MIFVLITPFPLPPAPAVCQRPAHAAQALPGAVLADITQGVFPFSAKDSDEVQRPEDVSRRGRREHCPLLVLSARRAA